jgi:[citrate (pro-3S)-lyase] ligase
MSEKPALRELFPRVASDRNMISSFLAGHNLRYEDDIEFALGLFDGDSMVACGCCAGQLLKCFAVDQSLRGQNILGSLVSALVNNRYALGFFDLLVITPPDNSLLFTNCGFHPVAATAELVFMERSPDGLERFINAMREPDDAGKSAAAIVVNCNPFTRGHRYLVEYAAARCELLHIFVVQEDRSTFPFDVRLKLVGRGVADLPNCRVHAGGIYIISSATFPTYFLKKADDAIQMQASLDATLFASRIAPLLAIRTRFVGSEPKCVVTSQYNRILHRILPAAGIELVEIPRCSGPDGDVISASRVRQLLKQGQLDESLLQLVPESTYQYLASSEAESVLRGLRQGT